MENATKYHLIVKAKELLLELEIKDLNSLKNNNLISLNASKVFELVYNNKELDKFYTNKLNTYNKLKASNNEYINALNLRLKQLKECQPLIQFCLNPDSLIYEQALFDVFEQNKIETTIKRSYNEFTIRLFDNKLKVFPYMNENKGIFAFIDNILSNTKLMRSFSIWDKNEYTQSISQLYDYYFLLNYEKDYLNTGMVIEKENDLYAYISYRKILKDILEYLYIIDLSKEQKQEYNIDKLLSSIEIDDNIEELQGLQNSQKHLLKCIAISENKKHLTELLKISKYPKQRVLELSTHFKDLGLLPKGGYDELKNLLKNHPEWFKKSYQSN